MTRLEKILLVQMFKRRRIETPAPDDLTKLLQKVRSPWWRRALNWLVK